MWSAASTNKRIVNIALELASASLAAEMDSRAQLSRAKREFDAGVAAMASRLLRIGAPNPSAKARYGPSW